MKIFTIASIPDELGRAWLQHLRDFDSAHPDCHFEVATDVPHLSLHEVIEMMRVNPELTFNQLFGRKP